jgi:hypothetical protein
MSRTKASSSSAARLPVRVPDAPPGNVALHVAFVIGAVGEDAPHHALGVVAQVLQAERLVGRSKKIIASALKSHPDRISFEKKLAKNGIAVLFRENEQGRIYGATFIDHEQKAIFNGSRLGKEFSANMFDELFRVSQGKEEHTKQEVGKEPFEPLIWQSDNIESVIGSLVSVLIPETGGHNGDNHLVARKRKKKKRRYGRQM